MKDKQFLDNYFDLYKAALKVDVQAELTDFKNLCLEVKECDAKLMIAGNGASASIASHAALDFTKQAKVRSMAFNDHNLITAFSNDYGYENWISEAVKAYGQKHDVVVLISSSGNSHNVVDAAKTSKNLGYKVVTFSGFSSSNELKQYGDINFWINSKAYNIIESVHGIWMFAVVDLLVGKAEYSVS
jgi:D-sedoheptulose 7-phosphate isomerase